MLDISCRLFCTLWDGKIFGIHFHRHGGSCSLSVVHSRYSSPLASSFFKAMSPNLICRASCLAWCPKWRASKNHILRASISGSWTPNWFSSKMRSTSSFVRATVAFGLFPLPCFLSSRHLDFRTSLDTLNSSSLRMFTFVLLSSRNRYSREGEHCVRFVFWIVLFLCSYIKIAQQTVQLF